MTNRRSPRFSRWPSGRRIAAAACALGLVGAAAPLVARAAPAPTPDDSQQPVVVEQSPAHSAVDLAATRRWLEQVYGQPIDVGSDEEAPDPDGISKDKTARSDAETAVDPDAKAKAPAAPAPVAAEALPTADRSGVTGKSISIPKGEGTIKGMEESFSAQLSTGIATYSVPFSLPAARGAAQPSLGISYSSSGGFGVVGVGWSLDAPFIARQTDRGIPSYADSASGAAGHQVFSHSQDRFVFNGGQELVPICVVNASNLCPGLPAAVPLEQMPEWGAGWMYFRARVEGTFPFLRFFWSPDHRSWRVQSQDGTTMEFGVPCGSTDESALEKNPTPEAGHSQEIYRWMLVRKWDLMGTPSPPLPTCPTPLNVVRYVYTPHSEEGGTTYLTDIYDTPPATNTVAASLAQYAHHTHLAYEDRSDPTQSYRSGWLMRQRQRLARVDVTSKPFGGGVDMARALVRSYALHYDPNYHVSLLASVTLQGRCSSPVSEGAGQLLPSPLGCVPASLPAVALDYSHVAGSLPGGGASGAPIAGYEAFDEQVRSLDQSPGYSLDEQQTALHDVNSDGLPDVLVTAPGFFGGKHGVFFNGGGGQAGRFKADKIGVHGVLGANEGTITLGNPNVVPMDLDGDGTADLLHMPLTKKYATYRPRREATGWYWNGVPAETADHLNPKIDFGRDASFTKVVDVNFDGLVDVVRTTGTRFETYFSLGRYPGGEAEFGHATRTGVTTAQISTDPVTMCIPWSGTSVSFGDRDTQLADMNGDGIVDIVRLRRGDIRYWPGRGNGLWGTGQRNDCPEGDFGQNRHVAMEDSPYYSDIEGDSLRLEDVNGDGLADLVQVRFQDVDVWLNADGEGWTHSHTLRGTPASPSYANRVRLTDINGSGTPDILWGDANHYRYIDLAGGTRPWLLTRVSNGLGKTTDIEYEPISAQMLAAEATGHAWLRTSPVVSQLVKRVTVSDNLTVGARGPSSDVTEYTYRDPLYDGKQREFRGFEFASAHRLGDVDRPGIKTETTFFLGECPTAGPPGEVCTVDDNPDEALKGTPYFEESLNDAGDYLGSKYTKYRLRNLFTGLDGRRARSLSPLHEQSFRYDGSPFVRHDVALAVDFVDLRVDPVADVFLSHNRTVYRRQIDSYEAGTLKAHAYTWYGYNTDTTVYPCNSGAVCNSFTQEAQLQSTPYAYVPNVAGKWTFLGMGGSVRGVAEAINYGNTNLNYDTKGRLANRRLQINYGVNLDRVTADTAFYPPASADSTAYVAGDTYTYDNFGNVLTDTGTNLRCRGVTYDTDYAHIPVTETVYPSGCGATPDALTTSVIDFDRGLGVPRVVEAPRRSSGASVRTTVEYDGLGRVAKVYRPGSTGAAQTSVATTQLEYFLPSASHPHHSMIHVATQDGATTADDTSRLETWSYVDGLGRTVATVKEAESSKWIVSGLTEYDNAGAVYRKYINQFLPDGSAPADYMLAATTDNRFTKMKYDGLGRVLCVDDIAGIRVDQRKYHALSTEICDAEDLATVTKPTTAVYQPTSHLSTCVTELRDGIGRVMQTSEAFRNAAGTLDARVTKYNYIGSGQIETIRRSLQSAPTQETTRYLVYDQQSRLVMNVEPNSSPSYAFQSTPNLASSPNRTRYPATGTGVVKAWRYRYNDAGDLVGVSDPRGCGANYFYDGLGRLKMEDLLPCNQPGQAGYTLPVVSGSTFLSGGAGALTSNPGAPTSGVEMAYEYDVLSSAPTPSSWSAGFGEGRLLRIRDLAAHTLLKYDVFGNVTTTGRKIARADASASDVSTILNRYTGTSQWWTSTTTYDAADRPVVESTGAQALLAPNGKSEVLTEYNARGVLKKVTSSYDMGSTSGGADLVTINTRSADGLVEELTYGDAAGTHTQNEYGDRRELSETTTYRLGLSGWPANELDTYQVTLEHLSFWYDYTLNPILIQDFRTAAVWPTGAKPVHRDMKYDDFNRVTGMKYTSTVTGGEDTWVSPFDDEVTNYSTPANLDSRRALPSPHVSFDKRVKEQTFTYDWTGNTTNTGDDANGFYDRSLGTVTNGGLTTNPYQLTRAQISTTGGARNGVLRATYDAAGNMTALYLRREGSCLPTSGVAGCSQVFKYEWDELNQLTRASRWDFALTGFDVDSPPSTSGTPVVDLRYRYDADGNRVVKTAGTGSSAAHTVYVFDTVELRRTAYTGSGTSGEYTVSQDTEVPYLSANGVRLGRVVRDTSVPQSGGTQHIFLTLADHLGSTSTVIDKATGELVEKSSYFGYGGADSDYRPARWGDFREDYRFTGKEEDVEVGLTYFGKRFYSAQLQRWMSPDPLGLHEAGKADLNLYAYVEGAALGAHDPDGLFKVPIHQEITRNALQGRYSALFMHIVNAQLAEQDNHQMRPDFHFDNSQFADSFKYLDEALKNFRSPPRQGRAGISVSVQASEFGKAAHAVQDFYAHSNFIDLYHKYSPSATKAPVFEDVFDKSNKNYSSSDSAGFRTWLSDTKSQIFTGYFAVSNRDTYGHPQNPIGHAALSKDEPTPDDPARQQLHVMAVDAATRATQNAASTGQAFQGRENAPLREGIPCTNDCK